MTWIFKKVRKTRTIRKDEERKGVEQSLKSVTGFYKLFHTMKTVGKMKEKSVT